jgi:hypothetical protein
MQNQSKVNANPEFKFTEDKWVISIINTADKVQSAIRGGHAKIVIEGIERGKTIAYQYDIRATKFGDNLSIINKKGQIIDIRYDKELEPWKDYRKYSSRSWLVDSAKANIMRKAIEDEHILVNKAKRGEAEYPPYQLLGENHPLSEIGMGDNCASWCIKKLLLAGIDERDVLHKPKKIVSPYGFIRQPRRIVIACIFILVCAVITRYLYYKTVKSKRQ